MNGLNSKMNSEIALFVIACGSIGSGILLSNPAAFDFSAVMTHITFISQTYWKVILVAALFFSFSVILRRFNTFSNILGAMGWFLILSPVLVFIKGLPSGVGLKGLPFIFGVYFFVISLSIILNLALRYFLAKLNS